MVGEIFSFAAGSVFTGTLSYLNSTWLEEVKTRKQVDAVLAAIHAEIKMLKQFYQKSAGELLQGCKDRKDSFCRRKFLHKLDYFIIYPGNTNIVGNLEDPLLVETIIFTYNCGNNLIESFEANNLLLDELLDLVRQEKRGDDETAQERRKVQEEMLASVFTRLQETYSEFSNATANLLENIILYRTTHPVSRIPERFRPLFDS